MIDGELHNGQNSIDAGLFIDLEAPPIVQIGACVKNEEISAFNTIQVKQALKKVEQHAAKLPPFVGGHNIYGHDLPILLEDGTCPSLHVLPVIDTLYLSPLAFPENPYHHLVKNDKITYSSQSNPVNDCLAAKELLNDILDSFNKINSSNSNLLAFYFSCFRESDFGEYFIKGIAFISDLLGIHKIENPCFYAEFISNRLHNKVCRYQLSILLTSGIKEPYVCSLIPYAVAWLNISGGSSILPYWVGKKFPKINALLNKLRDHDCKNNDCEYCKSINSPKALLKRYFNFESFRAEPSLEDDSETSLQEFLVRQAMNGVSLLGILPTGAGKSICFQLPALAKHKNRGYLTIVISPLQSLMKDQVDNLIKKTTLKNSAALYGMLTPPERFQLLEDIRLGIIGLLYISPEQLRSLAFKKAIMHRDIAAWVFDEAHCLSKWGHDFRPDYLYASRFIREFAEEQGVLDLAPIFCYTATAKMDVQAEIVEHFETELNISMKVLDGGAERSNLKFIVENTNTVAKLERLYKLMNEWASQENRGSAIIFCATRDMTEECRDFLMRKFSHNNIDLGIEAFHAGLEINDKKTLQDQFISGQVPIICTTNAFGMGVDKENVRLVVHVDAPASLENYLQEAGRAGRDLKESKCILLFDDSDIESQFRMSSYSKISQKDIQQIWKSILKARRDNDNTIVVSTNSLIDSTEQSISFSTDPDSLKSTKTKTAIAVLEKEDFLHRNENRPQVFQARPLVKDIDKVRDIIQKMNLSKTRQLLWIAIMKLFLGQDNELKSLDSIAELKEMEPVYTDYRNKYGENTSPYRPIFSILNEMAKPAVGLLKKDLLLSAFIKLGNKNSKILFEELKDLENDLIDTLREQEPDAEGWQKLDINSINQKLKNNGHKSYPLTLINLFQTLGRDSWNIMDRYGSIEFGFKQQGVHKVLLRREWDEIIKLVETRHAISKLVLELLFKKNKTKPNQDHLVEFSEQEIIDDISQTLFLDKSKDYQAIIQHTLLYLNDHNVIQLEQGKGLILQLLTLKLRDYKSGKRSRVFTKGHYGQLQVHYDERIFQIHVMSEYAKQGIETLGRHLTLIKEYFVLGKKEFSQIYFKGREEILKRATGIESYRKIVDSLNNPRQQGIVAEFPNANMLILAGPGSGKTRVIAHRCAYLLRVHRIKPRSILVVCFNRNASLLLRHRIWALAEKDAAGVVIQTYHGLAMKITGTSFKDLSQNPDTDGPIFDQLIIDATKLLNGEVEFTGLQTDDLVDHILGGYSHILIDEYQDVNEIQYNFISAIAGRTRESENKLSIVAVGDDDQNVYAFAGANVKYIKQFKEDYNAYEYYLTENYRSTKNIIDTGNELIANNSNRMKTGNPIQINKDRSKSSPGGDAEFYDSSFKGKVAILETNDCFSQARAVVNELNKLKQAAKDSSWADFVIFGRNKSDLVHIRAALEDQGIPFVWSADKSSMPRMDRITECYKLIAWLKCKGDVLITAQEIRNYIQEEVDTNTANEWYQLLNEVNNEWYGETANYERDAMLAVYFYYDALQDKGLDSQLGTGVYMSTAHSAKGMEFKHVIIADGNWHSRSNNTAEEEERRVFYVAMTRAKETLGILEMAESNNIHTPLLTGKSIMRVKANDTIDIADEILKRQYNIIGMDDVFITYAGLRDQKTRLHKELDKLKAGDSLQMKEEGGVILLVTSKGFPLISLSKSGVQKWKNRLNSIINIKIKAIIIRNNEDAIDFKMEPRVDQWKIPICEVCWLDR